MSLLWSSVSNPRTHYNMTQHKHMIKKLATGTFFSVIVFAFVSYVSVMTSLLSTVGRLDKKPVTNIGFPFKYYYQFWLRGADSPNCGWNIDYFLLDCLLTWFVTVGIYLAVTNRRT